MRAEQGLGDQIMFASCLHDVIALAQRVIIECDPRLIGLFTRSFPAASVHRLRLKGEPEWAREPAPDFQIHCGGLPGILRQHISDFPRHQGYLAPDPVRVARWQARFAALPSGLNIGLSWRGGTPRTRQTTRSISLTSLVPLLSVSRANFVSLQYGPCGDEISELRANHAVTLHDWLPATTDLEDVAALIANLDIVITVCTTVAHLCGALARTAWVMVPAVAEWRYLDDGSTLPWYPSVQLFRQQRRGAWGDVIASVGARLHTETERFFASGRSTSSLGRPE